MFNVGGPEVLVILLVALIVLGPKELPKAVRTMGNVMAEVRRMSSGFQEEIRSALDMPIEADGREQGTNLARTPQEADITETVARNPLPTQIDAEAVHFTDGRPAASAPIIAEASDPTFDAAPGPQIARPTVVTSDGPRTETDGGTTERATG